MVKYAPIKKLCTVNTTNNEIRLKLTLKKKIYFEKKQLILARTQVPPIFPFSPKKNHLHLVIPLKKSAPN